MKEEVEEEEEVLKAEKSKDMSYESERYSLDSKHLLGKGSFGSIYCGKNMNSNEEVAIKIEPVNTEQPQLIYEYKIYKILEGGIGFPKIYKYKTEKNYNILVMELLGDSIETIFNKAQKHFSLLTCIMIVDQILSRVEFMHSKNLLHRDIKPDNFLIGKGKKANIIYAIDFGLSKKYRESKTGLHIPYRDGKELTGTARYASINTHMGVEQSRRDDIESLGYMMVYLMKGRLPWQGKVNSNPKKRYDEIKKMKVNIKLSELCHNLPKECVKFIQYARDMKFEDKPNYKYLKDLLKKMAARIGQKIDTSKFDWIEKKEEEKNDNNNNLLLEK